MLTTAALLAQLAARHGSDAAIARALAVSRQALHLARQRNALSDKLIFAAAAALNRDPGTTLAEIRAAESTDETTKAAWLSIASRLATPPKQPAIAPYLYYVKSTGEEKCEQNRGKKPDQGRREVKTTNNNHAEIPLSNAKKSAYQLLQWCLMVPKIPPDSPRLAYYASRWRVPHKIERALADGSYYHIVKNCPPIDLCHLPAALAALDECRRYDESLNPTTPATLPTPAPGHCNESSQTVTVCVSL